MARNVLATFRVMPNSVDVDLDALAVKIRALGIGEIKDMKVQDIAFGLKELIVLVLVPDEGGVIETIEEKIHTIEEVEDAENTNVTLV